MTALASLIALSCCLLGLSADRWDPTADELPPSANLFPFYLPLQSDVEQLKRTLPHALGHPLIRFRDELYTSRDDDRRKKSRTAGELLVILNNLARRRKIEGKLKSMRFGVS